MKRDMELVRQLLFLIEAQEDTHSELKIPSEMDKNIVVYHLKLMQQAGLTENNIQYASDEPMWIYSQLTWEGHDFLDAIKNDNIWSKTKEAIKSKGLEIGQISFGVLKDFAVLKVKEKLGMI
ncbi:DUF2513 domain-containing protein [Bacillus smithii]|uniref:DUF2513 domain-containing protein n=1 Tax=Bacillus smithii TaxID=1479 RepID=UPI003D215376